MLSGVAFGLFGGSLGFLFGFGGRITTIPEVYRLRRFMDGDRVWILLAELFDGFFRSTRGGEDGAGVMPFGIREGLSGILDDVETGGAGGEERGDIGEPLAPAIFHFDVVEDVVEVRGPRGVREAFLTVRLAVVSCDGHELADGELVEVVACLPDVRLDARRFRSVTHIVGASAEPVRDGGGGGSEVEHALDGVSLLQHGELFALAALGDHGLQLLQRV